MTLPRMHTCGTMINFRSSRPYVRKMTLQSSTLTGGSRNGVQNADRTKASFIKSYNASPLTLRSPQFRSGEISAADLHQCFVKLPGGGRPTQQLVLAIASLLPLGTKPPPPFSCFSHTNFCTPHPLVPHTCAIPHLASQCIVVYGWELPDPLVNSPEGRAASDHTERTQTHAGMKVGGGRTTADVVPSKYESFKHRFVRIGLAFPPSRPKACLVSRGSSVASASLRNFHGAHVQAGNRRPCWLRRRFPRAQTRAHIQTPGTILTPGPSCGWTPPRSRAT